MSHMNQHRLTGILKNFCATSDYTFHSDYSGRGMYGKKCIGIEIPQYGSQFELAMDLATYFVETYDGDEGDILVGFDVLKSISADQLGLGTIVYWEDIKA